VEVGCAQGLALGGEADAELLWGGWAHAVVSAIVRRASSTDDARGIPLVDMAFLRRNSRV